MTKKRTVKKAATVRTLRTRKIGNVKGGVTPQMVLQLLRMMEGDSKRIIGNIR